MMGFMEPGFILTIVGMSIGGWIISTWLRVKHGYPLDDGMGNIIAKSMDDGGEKKLLEHNRMLTDRLENAEDRIAVLERIITDEGYHTAREIEALSDRTGAR